MPLITGSSLERAERCPNSYAYPQVNSTSAASEKGTENHAEIERAIRSGEQGSLSNELWVFITSFTNRRTEVGIALNVHTKSVRFIGARNAGGYDDVYPGEIALTVDFIGERDGKAWCIDWKSRARVTAAADNRQLLAGVVGTGATVGAIYYLDNHYCDSHEFSQMEIDAFWPLADEILGGVANAISVKATTKGTWEPSLHEGPWCDYCPAKFSCHAKTSYIKHALAIAPSEILSAERAGEIWGEIKKAKKIVETMEEAIKLMSKDVDIPLKGGKVLRQIPVTTTKVDAKAMEAEYVAAGKEVPKYSFTYYTTKEVKP